MKKVVKFFLMVIILFEVFQIAAYKVRLIREKNSYHTIQQKAKEMREEKNTNQTYAMDLAILKEQNEDLVGWIRIPSINLDYPIMQTKDNSYYLGHSFYKEKALSGSVFVDYRNNLEDKYIKGNTLDQNIIIYGHNMKNGTMFGKLKEYKNKKITTNNNLIVVNISDNILIYTIFAVYISEPDFEYRKIKYSQKELNELLVEINQKGTLVEGIELTTEDKILTLSTCDAQGRLVIHARLEK